MLDLQVQRCPKGVLTPNRLVERKEHVIIWYNIKIQDMIQQDYDCATIRSDEYLVRSIRPSAAEMSECTEGETK